MKHCRENYPNHASGQLLGLDFKNVLEISTAFPFPKLSEDKRDEVNCNFLNI
jgi:translation initiation factor 3 subunit H